MTIEEKLSSLGLDLPANVAPGFVDMPSVINGESDLLVEVFGETRGRHARVALGVASLSRGAPVETEVIVQIRA